MNSVLTIIRSIMFYVGFAVSVVLFGTISCLLALLPLKHSVHQSVVTLGNASSLLWLKITCGIRVSVKGLENLPDRPAVILSNHESTWETFFLQRLFRPVSTTIKKELLYIPFFGWGLYFMRPIAIDRGNPKAALKKLQNMGKQRLAEGNNLLIFPEGTRHKQGEKTIYARSGASIAIAAGASVIPVAHNAGEYWPNKGYLKHSGTIQVIIGQPIPSNGNNSRELTDQVQQWIEQQRAKTL